MAFRYLARLISVADGVSPRESEGYSLQWLIGGVGGGGVQPKRGTIFMLGISLVEVNERVGKSVILVGKNDLEGLTEGFYGREKVEKISCFFPSKLAMSRITWSLVVFHENLFHQQ